MDESAVDHQENEFADTPMDNIIEEVQHDNDNESMDTGAQEESSSHKARMIPLSVAQKLREKNKAMELQLQWERQERERVENLRFAQPNSHQSQGESQEDNSRYESATRDDLNKTRAEIIRDVEERHWIKTNPEMYERVNEHLPIFLKQRPNLAAAINQAQNRYEEAYLLMEALSPKQQQQLKKDVVQQNKRNSAPNAPTSVPKAAALNETVDVMNMSDSEFAAWRKSKKTRR